MINNVTLIGRLGADPELNPAGNTQLCQINLATSESYKDKDGNWQESTEWHQVIAWGDLAKRASESTQKGGLVYVEGKLKTDKYEKDGQTHYSTKIVASKIRRLEKKDNDRPPSQGDSQTGVNGLGEPKQVDDYDSLPF